MVHQEVGKSVALKTLAARNIATTGCGAFFIDVEGEYSNLTKMLGGKVIKIEQGKPAGINPFELEPDIKGNRSFLNIYLVGQMFIIVFPFF